MKILVIEDERSLVEVLSCNLEREGFEVIVSFDGPEGLRQAQLKLPDLVVLDLMLPLKSGLDVCRELKQGQRTRDIPIIMVTAKAEESDQLVGFATGADDYVTKPYSVKILIERIKKELRRRQLKDEPVAGALIESQGIVIDRHSHRAFYRDDELTLTPTEFRLLEVMLRQVGRAFTRFELMDAAIGEDAVVLEHDRCAHQELEEEARRCGRPHRNRPRRGLSAPRASDGEYLTGAAWRGRGLARAGPAGSSLGRV